MKPLETDKAPPSKCRAPTAGAHWIKPKLVAEIAFTEFTADGVLRHPSFLGAARGQAGEARWCREAPST